MDEAFKFLFKHNARFQSDAAGRWSIWVGDTHCAFIPRPDDSDIMNQYIRPALLAIERRLDGSFPGSVHNAGHDAQTSP